MLINCEEKNAFPVPTGFTKKINPKSLGIKDLKFFNLKSRMHPMLDQTGRLSIWVVYIFEGMILFWK